MVIFTLEYSKTEKSNIKSRGKTRVFDHHGKSGEGITEFFITSLL